MASIQLRQPLRHLFLGAAILSLLPAWLLTGGSALAVSSGCRTDPVVILSNGTIMDMSATIGTSLLNVQQVVYTLHAPPGTHVLLVIRTPDWPTTTENFVFAADAPSGEYDTDTIVYTADANVGVQATTSAGLRSSSATGVDRQHLQVRITR